MNKNQVKRILKFSAEWCSPCKVYAQTFDKVSKMEEFKNIEFKAMDIENDEEAEVLVEKYTIKSVPTTILLDENDDLIYKLIGNVPQKDLVNVINQTLNNGETV